MVSFLLPAIQIMKMRADRDRLEGVTDLGKGADVAARRLAAKIASPAQAASQMLNKRKLTIHTREMLVNGGGGLCLPPEALQPADILLTTADSGFSGVIRHFTDSTISHAAVFVGGKNIVDATSKHHGVRERPLGDVENRPRGATATAGKAADAQMQGLADGSTLVVAFRHRRMTSGIAQDIVKKLRSKVGKAEYDPRGAALGGYMSQHIGDRAALLQSEEAFYCSELVAWAFAEAGLPIDGVGREANTPGSLPKSADLKYIGHIKI